MQSRTSCQKHVLVSIEAPVRAESLIHRSLPFLILLHKRLLASSSCGLNLVWLTLLLVVDVSFQKSWILYEYSSSPTREKKRQVYTLTLSTCLDIFSLEPDFLYRRLNRTASSCQCQLAARAGGEWTGPKALRLKRKQEEGRRQQQSLWNFPSWEWVIQLESRRRRGKETEAQNAPLRLTALGNGVFFLPGKWKIISLHRHMRTDVSTDPSLACSGEEDEIRPVGSGTLGKDRAMSHGRSCVRQS